MVSPVDEPAPDAVGAQRNPPGASVGAPLADLLRRSGRGDEAARWLVQLRQLDRSRADTAAFLGAYYDPAPLKQILEGLEKAGFQ